MVLQLIVSKYIKNMPQRTIQVIEDFDQPLLGLEMN